MNATTERETATETCRWRSPSGAVGCDTTETVASFPYGRLCRVHTREMIRRGLDLGVKIDTGERTQRCVLCYAIVGRPREHAFECRGVRGVTVAEAATAAFDQLEELHEEYETDSLCPGDRGYQEAMSVVRGFARSFDLSIDEAWDWIAGAGWGR